MANEKKFSATIEVNQGRAQNELKKLENELKQLEDSQKRLLNSRKKGDAEAGRLMQKSIDDLRSRIGTQKSLIKGYAATLDELSDKSYKELKRAVKALEKELKSGNYEKHGREWEAIAKKIRECKKEMADYTEATKKHESVWTRLTNFLNKNWGAMTQIFGAITGLSSTIRSAVNDFAEMEEKMADTRKYTGLTAEKVRMLNERFKEMDTRTSREQLNELAGAAGRLGITSEQAIMDFVDAADKISVALGDDLGEGAVDQIGKLAMAFGEDEKHGLREAMLKTGSAINELAQNSAAKAGYLVEFAARVAGVGKQLGLTQAQIMGFGTVMDENLLKDEMAATAFSQFIMKMAMESAKFSKFAGMEADKFSKLVKEDLNGAILALADNMKKQDPTVMLKMFDDMGLDGTRAIGVLTNLADKIDDVRKHQETANKAYEEGKSVTEEFAVMNDTAQARMDKVKKMFKEMTVELGERLLPVVKYTISAAGMLAKGLNVLTGFVANNWKLIVTLTSGLIAYTVAVNIVTVKEKLHTAAKAVSYAMDKAWAVVIAVKTAALKAWGVAVGVCTGKIKLATAAQMLWNKVILVHPVVAVTAAVMGLVGAILSLVDAESVEAKVQKNVNAIKKEAKEKVKDEIQSINTLVDAANNERLTLEERKRAIDKLNATIPNYNAKLDATTGKYIANKKALDDYIASLVRMYEVMGAKEKLQEIGKKRVELELQLAEAKDTLKEVQERAEKEVQVNDNHWQTSNGAAMPGSAYNAHQGAAEIKAAKKEIESLNKEMEVLEKTSERIKNMYGDDIQRNEIKKTQPEVDPHKGGLADYKTEAELKKEERERRKQERERNAAQRKAEAEARKQETKENKERREKVEKIKAEYQAEIAEEMMAYRQGITTYSDYMEERHNITQNYYDAMKKLYGEDSTEYKKLLDDREKDEQEYYRWKTAQDERSLTVEKLQRDQSIRRQFMQQEIVDNEAMEEALFQSEIKYLRDRQELHKNGSQEWENLQMEIQNKEEEHRFELEQKWLERLSQYREEMAHTDYDKLMEIEIKGVETFYGALLQSGQMTKDEYDAIIEHIKRKYAELKGEQAANNDIKGKAAKGLETAKKQAGAENIVAGDDAATGVFSITQAVSQQKAINDALKQLYGEDYENNREYQEAKRQLDAETMNTIVAGAQAAYQSISSFMNAASSYAKASSDLEVAQITANYDKQIAAAGKNSKKKEKLEKERDKAIAAAKTKANKKAMAMEIAQAIAQTAMGAISAYSSTMAGAPYPANLVLAPISAGIALAAGALQIATIKKQHEAEAAGYYEGGFTGGTRYRKEAGVVHEGEFVANHQAVNNRSLAPVFSLIDQAQRNNRVGTLRAQDVTNVMGGPAAAVVAPVVNVQTDNSELHETLEMVRVTQDRLATQLEEGIGVDVPIDGENGIYRRMKKYESLMKNK